MSSQNTVYLNLREITELHKPDIQVKDVAEVYCSDAHVQNRCASLKIKTIRETEAQALRGKCPECDPDYGGGRFFRDGQQCGKSGVYH